MGALAEGLILGSAQRFGVKAQVQATAIEGSDGRDMRFVVDLV